MPKRGIRPHTWKVQGEIPHKQYCAWLQMKAQASYRGEEFLLTFEDFQSLWRTHWDQKGRGSDDYCLSRSDPESAWQIGNVDCVKRIEYLRRQKIYRQRERI